MPSTIANTIRSGHPGIAIASHEEARLPFNRLGWDVEIAWQGADGVASR